MIDVDKLTKDILLRCYQLEYQKELDAVFDIAWMRGEQQKPGSTFAAVAVANVRLAADLKSLEQLP